MHVEPPTTAPVSACGTAMAPARRSIGSSSCFHGRSTWGSWPFQELSKRQRRSHEMLSAEENDLLTRVGPGTPMGDLIRQYWLPALMSSELPAPPTARRYQSTC